MIRVQGHNDMDYEHGTGKALSASFSSNTQNRMIINSLLWLGKQKGKHQKLKKYE